MKLYGISNCDTVKKSRAWLAANGWEVEFHDFRKQGVMEAMLAAWLAQISRDQLVNRRGTTWRQLPEETKAAVTSDAAAIALMLEKPAIIKRPVLEKDGKIHVGFDTNLYQSLFGT